MANPKKKRILRLSVHEVSLVDRPAVEPALFILKKIDDETDAHVLNVGPTLDWATVRKSADHTFVLGPVLVPERFDRQGDIVSAEAIETAAHDYMSNAARIGLGHKTLLTKRVAEPIESFVCRGPTTISGAVLPAGTWVLGVRVYDDGLRKAIDSGILRGFSIGGDGVMENLDKAEIHAIDDATDAKILTTLKTVERFLERARDDQERVRQKAVKLGVLPPTVDDIATDRRFIDALASVSDKVDALRSAQDRIGSKLQRAMGKM
jgi:hypothetical protein